MTGAVPDLFQLVTSQYTKECRGWIFYKVTHSNNIDIIFVHKREDVIYDILEKDLEKESLYS